MRGSKKRAQITMMMQLMFTFWATLWITATAPLCNIVKPLQTSHFGGVVTSVLFRKQVGPGYRHLRSTSCGSEF
jgi:hypothetical protein